MMNVFQPQQYYNDLVVADAHMLKIILKYEITHVFRVNVSYGGWGCKLWF
jgi:hypothetical protein